MQTTVRVRVQRIVLGCWSQLQQRLNEQSPGLMKTFLLSTASTHSQGDYHILLSRYLSLPASSCKTTEENRYRHQLQEKANE